VRYDNNISSTRSIYEPLLVLIAVLFVLNPVNLGDLSYLNDKDVSLALALPAALPTALLDMLLDDLSVDLAYRG